MADEMFDAANAAMKSKRHRIRHFYYKERACDHWECEINHCLQTPKQEGELVDKPGLLLHPKSSNDASSTAGQPRARANGSLAGRFGPTSTKTLVSRDDSNIKNKGPSSKCSDKKQPADHRPSLAGFMFGDKDLEDIQALEGTERSNDDLKSTCSGVASNSEFFKTSVQSIELVDNTDQRGHFTGTVNKHTIKPHGYGTMVYPDAIYEGQWVNGDWCGFGHLTDISTGDVYQGGFFDNMKHGLGVMKYADGRIYDGMFMLDKLEGKGRLTEVDGTKFWGRWSKEGVPHGRGKKEYPDGKVYDGEFDQGVFSGHGRMTFPDGSWYLGEWCDGLPNGLGMKVDANGDLLFEGMYSNGEPIEASSMRHPQKSSGQFLLYRNSVAPQGHGTLVGPLPRQVFMRHRMDWALKNL